MVRLRAAIYARQSITREGSPSLDVHIEACRDKAKRLKVEVAAELVEARSTSGYRTRGRSRPKFQKASRADPRRRGRLRGGVQDRAPLRGGGPGWAPLVDAVEAAGGDPDRTVAPTDGWVSEFEIGIRSAWTRRSRRRPRIGCWHAVLVRRRTFRGSLAAALLLLAGHDPARRCGGPPQQRGGPASARRRVGVEHAPDWSDGGVPTVTGRSWTVQTPTSTLRSGRIPGLLHPITIRPAGARCRLFFPRPARDRSASVCRLPALDLGDRQHSVR